MSLSKHIASVAIAGSLLTSVTAPQPLRAQVQPQGQRGCANGTVVGGPNLVANGDFSIDAGPGPGVDPAAGFASGLVNRGPNTYPSEGIGGGFSIQRGKQTYYDGYIVGRPFPGDSQREVPPSETYFYSNPFNAGPEILLWEQEVSNLAPGTTYNFFAYLDNLVEPSLSGTVDPKIELRVDGLAAGPAVIVPQQPEAWLPIQFAFTTGANQNKVTLAIYDLANNNIGDDFAITQINLKQCASALGVAKSVGQLTKQADEVYDIPYTITVQNYGVDPAPVQNIQLTDDLQAAFARARSFSVVGLSSDRFSVNSAYNGRDDIQLLAAGNSIASGEKAAIQLVVRVQIGTSLADKGPYTNTAKVAGISGNVQIEDDSADGSIADVDGDGDPKDPSEDRPTPVVIGGVVYLPIANRR